MTMQMVNGENMVSVSRFDLGCRVNLRYMSVSV